MIKILVSACLLGNKVRYNACDVKYNNNILQAWLSEGRVVSFCPEVAGGFSVPRPPAEIQEGEGHRVLQGTARIMQIGGKDVTAGFLDGAKKALETALEHGVKLAIMKEKSPSCGSITIHDGTFSSNLRPGQGVATALLEQNGIRVFSEENIESAAIYLKKLEGYIPNP